MTSDYDSSIYSEIAENDAAHQEYLDAIDETSAASIDERAAVSELEDQFRRPWPTPDKVEPDKDPFEWEYSDGEHAVLEEEEGMNDQCNSMTALCYEFLGTSLF